MFALHVRLHLATCSSTLLASSIMEPTTLEWTCSEVLRLIREYGNRPALWDPNCEDYKNRFRKHHKWLELAAIFKCSKLEVERKVKILNSQYRRERLKAIKMRKAGLTHRVTWYGYKSFSFMNAHGRNRNVDTIKEEPESSIEWEPTTYEAIPEVTAANAPDDKVENDQVNKDEWTIFGELLTHALRKLRDDRTRCIVKHKINTLLYEAELAGYE